MADASGGCRHEAQGWIRSTTARDSPDPSLYTWNGKDLEDKKAGLCQATMRSVIHWTNTVKGDTSPATNHEAKLEKENVFTYIRERGHNEKDSLGAFT